VADRDPLVAHFHGHPLSAALPASVETAQTILGHIFARPELLLEALTHRSAALDSWVGKTVFSASNERLEFIGDRVLGLLVAEWMAERYPAENEGALGRRLALLVSQPILAEIAATLGLDACLSLSPSETRAGVSKRATVSADALEAAIGALYLDAGLDAARTFVRSAWARAMEAQLVPPKDAKTALQEWAMQRGKGLPVYKVVHATGPSHAPVFEISVTLGKSSEVATGGSKRQAEQEAAAKLLEKLQS
jgi:ribonuclease III